ncbi:glucuronate isomerase [Trueperella pecoris]|uniref:Uronate isomerase n=1 Tax=Trueperella pecoris TaxID=2733571 RepID=A0A7M1R127_9ACTO|nr:glucuronate isomerase [Trueperella pecoris]QOR47843.1 glucuronate isomerase [Trueperella pecoris]
MNLEPHPDRLFPSDPTTRDIARKLYSLVKDEPIISPHGHVPPQWIAEDTPFTDPTSLLITPDHYVNRMLHSHGVQLSELGVGQTEFTEEQSRAAFRILCSNWWLYRGTPVKYWMENELYDYFGVRVRPSAETADEIYDQIADCLQCPEYRPRALYKRFNLAFLATTDDPCDTLEHHKAIREDESFDGVVVPTFRPDKYLEPGREGWAELMGNLSEASGIDTTTWAGFNAAMENRRAYFKAAGAISTDHSHRDPGTARLSDVDAERLYKDALAGKISSDDADALRRSMMYEQVRMASEDGLVMTLHPGVYRNHHTPSFTKYGADVGCDIPLKTEFTDALQPALADFGDSDNLHLIPFTMDETVYSRELAPMAGFYKSVFIGVPWWFIDAPEAMARFRGSITETAGFTRTSGFIDDTRAYCSIPARHDVSRRVDSGYVAKLVAEHRLEMDEAEEAIKELVVGNPRRAFKLDGVI